MPDIILRDTPTYGGARAFIGNTGTGKTYKAVETMNRESREWKYPKGVLDLAGAASFDGLPLARDVDDFSTALFIRREDAPIWRTGNPESPKVQAALKKFWERLRRWGGCCILVDEIWRICSPSYCDDDFVNVSNEFRHGPLGPIFFYYTAQRSMYVNQKLFPAIKRWSIFQAALGEESDLLSKRFGRPPGYFAALKEREYDVYENGRCVETYRLPASGPQASDDVPSHNSPRDGGISPPDAGCPGEVRAEESRGGH